MSRLTKYCIDGYIARNFDYDSLAEMSSGDCEVFNDVVDKLGRYETLEDKGRLIELPCLPNEEVWESNERFGTHKTMYASREAIVGAMEAGYAIGYTKEAAEAKLAEMEGAE